MCKNVYVFVSTLPYRLMFDDGDGDTIKNRIKGMHIYSIKVLHFLKYLYKYFWQSKLGITNTGIVLQNGSIRINSE